LPLAERASAAAGSPAAFMLRWARELVVDRTVLVYAPPLHDQVGPRLGPVRLFADLESLWLAASQAGRWSEAGIRRREGGHGQARADEPLHVRIFPQGGLTYAPSCWLR